MRPTPATFAFIYGCALINSAQCRTPSLQPIINAIASGPTPVRLPAQSPSGLPQLATELAALSSATTSRALQAPSPPPMPTTEILVDAAHHFITQQRMDDALAVFEGHFDDGASNAALPLIARHYNPTSPLYATLNVKQLSVDANKNNLPFTSWRFAEHIRLTTERHQHRWEEQLRNDPPRDVVLQAFLAIHDDVSVQEMRRGTLDVDEMKWVRMHEDAARYTPETLARDVRRLFVVFGSTGVNTTTPTLPLGGRTSTRRRVGLMGM